MTRRRLVAAGVLLAGVGTAWWGLGGQSVGTAVAGESVPPGVVKPAVRGTDGTSWPELPGAVFGFRDFARDEARWDREFLRVPDARLAGEHLRRLTEAPHWAGSSGDYQTALYVAARFREAGLQTEMVPYSVRMNRPVLVQVDAVTAAGERVLTGPTEDHSGAENFVDRGAEDTRVGPAFNGGSPSGDVTGTVVYANYGRLSDFAQLAQMHVSLKGRIVLMRYGGDFRGVKVYLAQQYGAAGVLLYSDPVDEGSASGAVFPEGTFRPDGAAQRGSVQFLPVYPGDPTTPGVASAPGLKAEQRLSGRELDADLPRIPVTPLSASDAGPILRALGGLAAPHDWQGGLGIDYRIGTTAGEGSVAVHLRLVQETKLRTVWDVIGKIPGSEAQGEWVIAGNHRDAWAFGAADPGSGTAAMLEAVHGLGALLKQGWRPKRTVVVASWDAEEEGLMGSTEWAEQHAAELKRAAAYLNIDVGVSGPFFNAGAVPSLRRFVREVTEEVPSPAGGSVYARWQREDQQGLSRGGAPMTAPVFADADRLEPARVGELGSGSDYTPFLQHFGVPSTDIGSDGPFGVYHTVYDNYAWFTRFADPGFLYTQQQARVLGLEVLHLADADVLPLDDKEYGQEIRSYLEQARSRAVGRGMTLDFGAALTAAERFETAGAGMLARQTVAADGRSLDEPLVTAERALLLPGGLPRRPWYRHSVYAPGEFTGYAAVVIPGVNEAIDAMDAARAQTQLTALAGALERAARLLEARPAQGTRRSGY